MISFSLSLSLSLSLCVCLCLFSFTVKASEQNNKSTVRVQVTNSMLKKYICVKYLFSASKTIIERTFKLATVQKSVNETGQKHEK